MSVLPKKITIDYRNFGRIEVDGQLFPFHVSADFPIRADLSSKKDGLNFITLTLITESVEIIPANNQEADK